MKRSIWLMLAISVFMAGPVVADDEGEENGIKHRVATLEYYVDLILDWITSFEEQKGSAFQVYDSEGKQVGELLGMANPWNAQLAMVALEIEGHQAVVRFSRHGIWWEELVFFADPDCQGPAYLPSDRLSMTWFEPPVLVSVLPGIPWSRAAFVPIDQPPASWDQIVKVGFPEGCGDLPGPPPEVEFIAVAPIMRGDGPVDLNFEYPPPYHLSD